MVGLIRWSDFIEISADFPKYPKTKRQTDLATLTRVILVGFFVAGDGIEPSTSRFSVARSYQLSYPANNMEN